MEDGTTFGILQAVINIPIGVLLTMFHKPIGTKMSDRGKQLNLDKIVGEKLRRLIEETSVKHNDQEVKVTVSIGGSSYPELECDSFEELVNNADINLYEAKDTGRNKVVAK